MSPFDNPDSFHSSVVCVFKTGLDSKLEALQPDVDPCWLRVVDLMDGTAGTQPSDPVPLGSDAWVPGGILLGRHFLIVVELFELFPVPNNLGVHGVNIPILG